jgi:hypothetical protein
MCACDYYIDKIFVQSEILGGEFITITTDPSELMRVLQGYKITHIFINEYVVDKYGRPGIGQKPFPFGVIIDEKFLNDRATLVFRDDKQFLYKIKGDTNSLSGVR